MDLIKVENYVADFLNLPCDRLRNQTIIISGATGMIGSCLIDAIMYWNTIQDLSCKIYALGRSSLKAKQRFSFWWNHSLFSFLEQDICNPLFNMPNHADYIIHAASYADPINFAKFPVDTLLSNIIGTNSLLQYSLKSSAKRFLFVSSGEMYGQPDDNASDFIESYSGPIDYSSPRSCYPSGKRSSEVLCQSYISQYGLDAVIVRPCHIFGPTMTSSDSRAVSEFIRNAVEHRDIILKSPGLIERSHCYVIDAVSAILTVLLDGVCGSAYNIADKTYQMTIRNFAMEVAKAGNCSVIFENPSDMEAKGYSKISRSVLDASKLNALGWNPQLNNLAIAKTVKILQNQKMGVLS